jgi:hypothetical protein
MLAALGFSSIKSRVNFLVIRARLKRSVDASQVILLE